MCYATIGNSEKIWIPDRLINIVMDEIEEDEMKIRGESKEKIEKREKYDNPNEEEYDGWFKVWVDNKDILEIKNWLIEDTIKLKENNKNV